MASRESQLVVSLVDDVSPKSRTVSEAMQQMETRVREAAAAFGEDAAVSDKFIASLARIGASAKDIEQVSAAFVDYTRVAGITGTETENLTREQIAGVRRWESTTLTSLRAVMRERAAETQAMRAAAAEQNQILAKQAAEQATIQRETVRAQKEAAAQRRELARGIGAGVGGIGGMIVGGATLEAIKESAGLGATVDDRLAQLKSMGVTDAQIEASRAQFREFSKTHPGILEADWLKARGEASTVAPGDEAEMTELAARYRAAARASGTPLGENDFLATMRAMDEMGIRTPEKREEFLNNMLKMQQKFQGTVTPETYLSAVQNLRSAKFSLDDDFIKNYFPTLIQATGEQGGTEVMTAFNNYIGGHMQHSELKKLAAAGFVRNEDLDYLKNGEIKGVKPGAELSYPPIFSRAKMQLEVGISRRRLSYDES